MKLKQFYLFAALMISMQTSFAQWALTNGLSTTVLCLEMQDTVLFAGNSSGLYKTIDNGNIWSTVNNSFPGGYIYSIAIKDSSIFVGTLYGVYNSNNNGSSWVEDTTGLPFNFGQCAVSSLFINDSTIFAGLGGGGVYKKNINDTSWSSSNVGIINAPSTYVNEFTKSGSEIFACTDSQGKIYKTSNNGANWSLVSAGLPLTAQIKAVHTNGSTIFAGTYIQGIYVSNNQGASWTSFNSGIPSNSQISSFVSVGTCMFAGTFNNGVYLLFNGDTSWQNVNTGLFQTKVFSLGTGNSLIFAGSWDGGSSRKVVKRPLADFLPSIAGTPSGQSTLCAGIDSSAYSSSGSILATSYLWSLLPSSAGTMVSSDTAVTIFWDSTFVGSAILKLQGANCFGNGIYSNGYTILVNPLPNPTITASSDTTFCQGDSVILTTNAANSYNWSSGELNQSITVMISGSYSVSITDTNGCSASSPPKTVTVNLVYNISDPATAICSGDSSLIYGTYRTTTGTYYDSLITINGCDSIHSTELTINPNYSISDPAIDICAGDSTQIYGTFHTLTGTYYDSLTTSAGCDSIHSTMLTVYPTFSFIDSGVTICNGDSMQIYGIYRTTAGTYYDSLTTIDGCDSVYSTLLTVNPSYSISDIGVTICNSDSALIYGNYRTTAGLYYDSFTTVIGCDSLHSTVLTVNPTYNLNDPAVAICDGDSVVIFGTYQKIAGTYIDSSTTVSGCDSITTTTLTVNTTYSANTSDETICNGDSVLIFGVYRKTAGTYYDSLSTTDGCDSIISTTLTVNSLPSVSFSGLDTGYCTTDAPVILTGSPTGGTFSGAGMGGNMFEPGVAGIGTHIIIYSYTDNNSCTNSESKNVNVNNCTGIYDINFINHFAIFPNPNTGDFNITINIIQRENLELKIINSLGQVIFTEKLNQFKGSYSKQVDLNEYSTGIYSLQLITDKGVISRQIIIE